MSTFTTLELSKDGPVATITLNRPAKLNSISDPLRRDLQDAFALLARHDSIRVVRLAGAGRAFSAGYDLEGGYEPLRNLDAEPAEAAWPGEAAVPGAAAAPGKAAAAPGKAAAVPGEAAAPAADAAAQGGDWLTELGRSRIAADSEGLRDTGDWLLRLRRFEKPVIAQVHGYCLSGALDLISICDIVIAGASARFGHPAARGLGVPPLLGMLPFKIGALRTKEILFTGDLIDAEQAERWGLINRVVPDDQLEDATRRYCARVAMMHRESLAVHKQVTNRWIDLLGLQAAMDLTVDLDAIAHESPFLAEFGRRASEESVKAALEWRDGPYRG